MHIMVLKLFVHLTHTFTSSFCSFETWSCFVYLKLYNF